MYATISADVISYTLLAETDKRLLENSVQQLLNELTAKYRSCDFYGRLVQGDYLECAMGNPAIALRVALMIKSFVKSLEFKSSGKQKKLKHFFEYGVRLALAVAPLTKLDPDNGIIDGEAIYSSGRTIKNYSTSDKKRVVIKKTMFFTSTDEILQHQMGAIFSLLDILISKCSAKQCEVVYYKLKGFTEKEIAAKIDKYQSTVSQHSTSAGWNAIEETVVYFEKLFAECC